MRYTATVLLLSVLVLAAVAPLAQADEPEPLIITPYRDGPDYYACAGQVVIIRAHWGACNRGLTQAFIESASMSMEVSLNASPWLTVDPPSRKYWLSPVPREEPAPSGCVMQTATVWDTEWLYSLGRLEPGVYELHFVYALGHQVVDGGDWDGDGRIDHFSGVLQEADITIHVS